MKKVILRYSLLLFFALAVFKALEYTFFSHKISLDIYLGLTGISFLLLGAIAVRYFWPRIEQPHPPQPDADMFARLSEREKQLLPLLAHGYTNDEIAQTLHLSPNTVKTHLKNLFVKLGVSNRTQAVAEAKLLNLL